MSFQNDPYLVVCSVCTLTTPATQLQGFCPRCGTPQAGDFNNPYAQAFDGSDDFAATALGLLLIVTAGYGIYRLINDSKSKQIESKN